MNIEHAIGIAGIAKGDRHVTPRTSVVIKPPLHAAIKALAKKNHRKIQTEICLAIAMYLKENKVEVPEWE